MAFRGQPENVCGGESEVLRRDRRKAIFLCFGKYSSELVKKQFGQARCETWDSVALVLCCSCTNMRQYRTKSVWRLCTPSACKFPVIFHKNAREYSKYSLRFLFHLTKKFDDASVAQSLCGIAVNKGVLFPCSPFFLKRRFAEQAEENSAVMRRQCAC